MRFSIKASTRSKIATMIGEAQARQELSPHLAPTLRGKSLHALGFARVGRSVTQPRVLHEHALEDINALDGDLEEALSFLRALMWSNPVFTVSIDEIYDSPVVIASGAMYQEVPPKGIAPRPGGYPFGYCRVAFVMHYPVAETTLFAECVLPDKVLQFFHALKAKRT